MHQSPHYCGRVRSCSGLAPVCASVQSTDVEFGSSPAFLGPALLVVLSAGDGEVPSLEER